MMEPTPLSDSAASEHQLLHSGDILDPRLTNIFLLHLYMYVISGLALVQLDRIIC